MKILNPLFFTLLLFACSTLNAQLSSHARIWDGGLTLAGNGEELGLSAKASFLHFLSPRFALGGQLDLTGDFNEGIDRILLSPEIRYYLNPEHPNLNWFAGLGSRIPLYRGPEVFGDADFQMIASLGNNLRLGNGIALENKLSANFEEIGTSSIVEHPSFSLSSRLVYLQDPARQQAGDALIPSLGHGTWMISGDWLQADYQPFLSIKNFDVSFSPSLGYFLSDRMLLGADLTLGYGYLTTDFTIEEQNFTRRSFTAGISPFLRYYTSRQKEGRIQPYLELRGNFVYTEHVFDPENTNNSLFSRANSASLGGGIDIFLNSNVALEAGLNLGRDFQTGKTQVGLQLGLKYFLKR